MRVVTLRIKKKYQDAIRRGEKRIEYRKDTPYYHRLFHSPPDVIVFHYQNPDDKLVCDVVAITLIERPSNISFASVPTEKCYAIAVVPAPYRIMADWYGR